jgi:hypothetical protein
MTPAPVLDLHARFLELEPRVRTHARIQMRDVACPDRREELVAEAVALAWLWFLRLARKGQDARAFTGGLAAFAARAARSGRRVTGQERADDVLSPVAQRRHGFAVGSLPGHSTLAGTAWDEALRDNTRSEVPDQAAFRIDFPAWRQRLTARDRRIVDELMVGEGPQRVARRHGLTAGRVSQLRRRFREDWQRFHGQAAPPVEPTGDTRRAR